jgi:catechol 2,3-dioxygenase-like lactoylglutathione lyase family enzyme
MPSQTGYDTTRMKIHLGAVGHFGLAVRDPKQSAKWWQESFDLETIFTGDDYVGLSNDEVTIVLSQGTPDPAAIDHMSFHLPDMNALRAALDSLKQHGVAVEDPGDEIGPEAEGSKNMGLWFHDPDGYRWELSVQGGR